MFRRPAAVGAICLGLVAMGPFAAHATEDIASVNATAQSLDDAAVDSILRNAVAATGCMVPLGLVAAFETFLITQGMADLGVEIDRQTALSASFAARFDQTIDDHPYGVALVAVADATRGAFVAAERDGRLQMAHLIYEIDGCVPTGNVFVLREYAE